MRRGGWKRAWGLRRRGRAWGTRGGARRGKENVTMRGELAARGGKEGSSRLITGLPSALGANSGAGGRRTEPEEGAARNGENRSGKEKVF